MELLGVLVRVDLNHRSHIRQIVYRNPRFRQNIKFILLRNSPIVFQRCKNTQKILKTKISC